MSNLKSNFKKMKYLTKLVFSIAIICLATGLTFSSCSKDDDKDKEQEKQDIIGTWTASTGKYNLSLKMTASSYDFNLSQPGKGGVYDKGTYELSNDGKLTLVNNQDTPLAMGQLKNGKLTLTFVNSIMIMMLGTEAASSTTFTLSDDDTDDDDNDNSGLLVIQNLSDNHTIVSFVFYDEDGDIIETDDDELEADYQFTYEVFTGSYKVKITNNLGKSYTSKTFKIIKDKVTVLAYNGSSINILATGIDESELRMSTTSGTILGSKVLIAKSKRKLPQN